MVGIISNFAAAATQKNLGKASDAVTASISRLSSGNKIASAKDDVAGLAVGTILKTNIASLDAAVTNAGQATTMLGVMDGALEGVSSILSRQKSLASQATSGSLDATARGYLNQEFQNLKDEINRIANNTEFNGIKLIDGTLNNTLTLAATAAGAYVNTGSVGAAVLHATDATALVIGSAFDNTALIGADKFTISGTSALSAGLSSFTMTVGDKTYSTATNVDLEAATAINMYLDGDTGNTNNYIRVTLAAVVGSGLANTQSELDAIINNINTDLTPAVISQTRSVSTYSGTGSTLTGTTLAMRDTDFSTLSFSDITATENGAGEYDIAIEANGKTYSLTTTSSGQVAAASATASFTATDGSTLRLTNGAVALNLVGKSDQFVADFKASLADATGALDFQVGTEATNKISISAAGAKTINIYKNDAGAATTIDITTQVNAETAGSVLTNAINSVISSRANVGALQSRFGYASDNITSTIENLDAARSVFLDTDVAIESSALAAKQIQVQASISMLAKANSTLEKLAELLR
jgi:flagellin